MSIPGINGDLLGRPSDWLRALAIVASILVGWIAWQSYHDTETTEIATLAAQVSYHDTEITELQIELGHETNALGQISNTLTRVDTNVSDLRSSLAGGRK